MSVFLPDVSRHLNPSSEAVTRVSVILSQSLATDLNLETLLVREIGGGWEGKIRGLLKLRRSSC